MWLFTTDGGSRHADRQCANSHDQPRHNHGLPPHPVCLFYKHDAAHLIISVSVLAHCSSGKPIPVNAEICSKQVVYSLRFFWPLVCAAGARTELRSNKSWGTLMALTPSPQWLDTGNNAWQLAAATFV